ncbi:hypothetical protein F4810DRAFT_643997 [Camillea tinctor]|nr:hypothetical protein F4810DRAFT_643997 [Camillea tinctor]
MSALFKQPFRWSRCTRIPFTLFFLFKSAVASMTIGRMDVFYSTELVQLHPCNPPVTQNGSFFPGVKIVSRMFCTNVFVYSPIIAYRM